MHVTGCLSIINLSLTLTNVERTFLFSSLIWNAVQLQLFCDLVAEA